VWGKAQKVTFANGGGVGVPSKPHSLGTEKTKKKKKHSSNGLLAQHKWSATDISNRNKKTGKKTESPRPGVLFTPSITQYTAGNNGQPKKKHGNTTHKHTTNSQTPNVILECVRKGKKKSQARVRSQRGGGSGEDPNTRGSIGLLNTKDNANESVAGVQNYATATSLEKDTVTGNHRLRIDTITDVGKNASKDCSSQLDPRKLEYPFYDKQKKRDTHQQRNKERRDGEWNPLETHLKERAFGTKQQGPIRQQKKGIILRSGERGEKSSTKGQGWKTRGNKESELPTKTTTSQNPSLLEQDQVKATNQQRRDELEQKNRRKDTFRYPGEERVQVYRG